MLDAGERRLRSGVVVHVWTPREPHAVAVVQHGYGEYAERFVQDHGRLVPRLVAAGFEVWAMDLWGHGESPGTRGVTHVGRAVRDHVEARRDASAVGLPVVLIGHSLGGLVTAGSVVDDPDGLAGVVLSSSSFPSEPQVVRRGLGLAARLVPQAPIPVRASPISALSHDPDVVVRAARDPRMTHRQVPLVLAVTALDVMDEVRSRAPAWTVPTLVLHGSADLYTDPQGSRDLFEAIASSDKTLRSVDGGFHELFHDTDGDELAEDVIAWALARTS